VGFPELDISVVNKAMLLMNERVASPMRSAKFID
jgi:hypothetical protein